MVARPRRSGARPARSSAPACRSRCRRSTTDTPIRYQTTPATTRDHEQGGDAEAGIAAPAPGAGRRGVRAGRPTARGRRADPVAGRRGRDGRAGPRSRDRADRHPARRRATDRGRCRAGTAWPPPGAREPLGGSAGERSRRYRRAAADGSSGSADDEVDQPPGHDDDLADRRARRAARRCAASARAAASSSSSLAPAGTVTLRPHLAVDLHRDLDRRPRRGSAGSALGERLVARATSSWPSRSHSSSATCGASGASISTSGSTTSRGRAPVLGDDLRQPVVELEQPRDRGVELAARHVVARPRRSCGAGCAGSRRRPARRSRRSSPVSSSTTLRQSRCRKRCTPTMSVGAPRPARVERTHEHLVEPQRVGAVVAVDVVGRDDVLQALAHLRRTRGRPASPSWKKRAVALLDLARLDVRCRARRVNAGAWM